MTKYLYNGVELPDINEVWTDKTSYPYAVITFKYNTDGTFNYAVLYLFEDVSYIDIPMTGYSIWAISTPNGYKKTPLFYPSKGGTWGELEERDSDYWGVSALSVDGGWSNFDVLYRNGAVICAASDPVPVEPEEPEQPEEPVTTLTARDLYKKINGKPTKLTLYKKLGGKLIPLNEHTKEVKT